LVAWNKLAEICAQLLKKGRKVFVEGRLSTRSWQGQDGAQKQRTEVVISDMVILDRKMDEPSEVNIPEREAEVQVSPEEEEEPKKPAKKTKKKEEEVLPEPEGEDIPF
ncbi:MAG: Single-stranded DNA-binding protein, partial [Candidatus Woesebacteria bacterium GW2011_GWB1_45_5]